MKNIAHKKKGNYIYTGLILTLFIAMMIPLLGCGSKNTRVEKIKKNDDSFQGSLLEKYLKSQIRDQIICAVLYIGRYENKSRDIPEIKDSSYEAWKEHGETFIKWIKKQNKETVENLVKGFPNFAKEWVPLDPDDYLSEEMKEKIRKIEQEKENYQQDN